MRRKVSVYRATVKFKEFKQQGWDSDVSFFEIIIEDKHMDNLKDKVKDLIHKECYISKGDFGLILAEVDHVDTKYVTIKQREIVEAV